ncbi:cobalt-precorrin-5B (C(1))-methyltransferase [Aestuariirhabdus litorea]|uniref:Cobalt-precorrin-5B C(1)-methyltransferase n=1 Tax=Aestuariirhabdus litorea TaxID=2528527 RepID=A0A3P3VP41_9GAMM|nr:cobalt-precorrin-5B (C(1))-methyltransferase [Aestuariirhabdus litorea]RRJ84522.1 cobalt-precorrin-5B (C(1))-methyltransferase [Aestuariirhabdus litorea]RWW97747.1 cobalt-precorrin-5B (C(1))-methyltransferase [Endozoicomonadaceae bacterium GTF-13]
MREESPEQARPLRHGYTTGACATVTALAAASLLLGESLEAKLEITLPRGQRVALPLTRQRLLDDGRIEVATIKDAGDDPDVTHGATLFSRVALVATPGVRFVAGEGVGRVTLPGLPIPPGEPAINPVPRRMISEHLERLAREKSYSGGFVVEIGVENGAQLATRTMNPRLGIVGGLSILGTTGIVRPFSCSAYIASIHQGMDVAASNGYHHIALCTGSNSERGIKTLLGLEEIALVEIGDFVGAALKHLHKTGIRRLSIAGGFGKLSKLAEGHLDLHSRHSSIDLASIAGRARAIGGSDSLFQQILAANSSLHALQLCQQASLPIADRICADARHQAQRISRSEVAIDVWAFDREGQLLGSSG